MVKNNQIKKITIRTLISEGLKHYEAHVTSKEDKKFNLPIADADTFVKNLDISIELYITQGAPYTHGQRIDIEYRRDNIVMNKSEIALKLCTLDLVCWRRSSGSDSSSG
jgi:hypothetical protein